MQARIQDFLQGGGGGGGGNDGRVQSGRQSFGARADGGGGGG